MNPKTTPPSRSSHPRKTIFRRYLMMIASTFTRTTTAQKMVRKARRLR